jgi:hypothetical protein
MDDWMEAEMRLVLRMMLSAAIVTTLGLGSACSSGESTSDVAADQDVTVDTGDDTALPEEDTAGADATVEDVGLEDTSAPDTSVEDAAPDVVEPDVPKPPHCEWLGLPVADFNTEGPFGVKRHDVADDFTFYPMVGDSWVLSENWTGCDTYVFITNARPLSKLNTVTIWSQDLDGLLQGSPKNVHYFFVATTQAGGAMAFLENMQIQVETLLNQLPAADADHWKDRLHVAGGHISNFPNWLKNGLSGDSGYYGIGIDRHQRVRTLGSFADVTRYVQALNDAGEWPWENNMAYAAHEVRWYNAEIIRDAELATHDNLTLVTPWEKEVLKHWVEKEVEFPDAETMATYDSFMIDLTMDCADPEKGEFGNCGAWDYLSHLKLKKLGDEGGYIELARFITTYHREGRYVVDATPLLSYLREGGTRTIRFDISPEWNQQAYLTTLHFRFRTASQDVSPAATTFLFGGGGFNADYNSKYEPQEVEIPASATKVEVWAIITGHGMDTDNCAEFCDHHHKFTVNGSDFMKTHPEVGNQVGCIAAIENGMTPNQGGTWWFGRGGWCPGQQVEPFVADVTDAVVPGEAATITYEGTYKGVTPQGNYGNINMSSFLVVYE